MNARSTWLHRQAMPALFGVALAGGFSSLPVFAQNRIDSSSPGALPEWNVDPLSTDYPLASLDSLTADAGPNATTRMRFHRRATGTAMDTEYGGLTGSIASYRATALSPWPGATATGGSYVYVLRGSTLFQMRRSDFSLVSQKALPLVGRSEQHASNASENSAIADAADSRTANPEEASADMQGQDTAGVVRNVTPVDTNVTADGAVRGKVYRPASDPGLEPPPVDNSNPTGNPQGGSAAADISDPLDLPGTTTEPATQDQVTSNSANGSVESLFGMRGLAANGRASVIARGDYVYVLQGNRLWQLRASDLSIVLQKIVPTINEQ